jgi:hypothetical protein
MVNAVRRLAALALPAALAALACNPGFDPQYRVTDLRILAVQAEVPGSAGEDPDHKASVRADPTPADALQLRALVVDPKNRGLSVRWFVCAPSAGGALPPCVDPVYLRDPSSLASAGAFELPDPFTGPEPPPIPLSSLPGPVLASLGDALTAVEDLATAQPTYQCRVYVEIPIVAVATAGDRQETALKRVRLVRSPTGDMKYKANRNPFVGSLVLRPTDEDLCTGGTSLAEPASFPAGTATVCATWDVGTPPEGYNVCDAAGNAQETSETYGWQWYVTGGEFKDVGGLGNAEGTHLDFTAPKGTFTLWLILRDGRGGEGWKQFDLTAP